MNLKLWYKNIDLTRFHYGRDSMCEIVKGYRMHLGTSFTSNDTDFYVQTIFEKHYKNTCFSFAEKSIISAITSTFAEGDQSNILKQKYLTVKNLLLNKKINNYRKRQKLEKKDYFLQEIYLLVKNDFKFLSEEEIKCIFKNRKEFLKNVKDINKYIKFIVENYNNVIDLSNDIATINCEIKKLNKKIEEKRGLLENLPIIINIKKDDYNEYKKKISDKNKLFVYDRLTKNVPDLTQITMKKTHLNPNSSLGDKNLFSEEKSKCIETIIDTGFEYPQSTKQQMHWTANFADNRLFHFAEKHLFAQDEIQVLEHPSLLVSKKLLTQEQLHLDLFDVALFQNVPRLGNLDTTTKVTGKSHSLYGPNFKKASQQDILSRLTDIDSPTNSNIFAISAPKITKELEGKVYSKEHLEQLFFTFYNACVSIKNNNPDKQIIMHSGNWGAGAFGNDIKTVYLLQCAAARCVGIDELRIYTMERKNTNIFNAAVELLQEIEKKDPNMTINSFLERLVENANTFDLKYRKGNGT
jgi:hypothetical protein